MMGSNEKLIELCPDRSLLNPEFGGYKLSLSPVPVHKREINGVNLIEPSEDQFSYLHQKEFTLHNHLHGDVWNDGSVYYVDKQHKIMKVAVNPNSNHVENPEEVWELINVKPTLSGDYNASVCFASSDVAVVSDGSGSIFILETYSREKFATWKLLHFQNLPDEKRGFKVVDSRSVNEAPNRVVWCILRRIEQCEINDSVVKDKKVPRFEAIVNVVSFIEERGTWKLGDIKKVCNAASVEYSVLEPNCKAVYIAGDIPMPAIHQNPDQDGDSTPEYFWQQNFEEIKIWLDVDKKIEKKDIDIDVKDNEIEITIGNCTLLEGKLFKEIKRNITTWTFENNRLEVVIPKNEGSMWRYLVEGSAGGKEVVDQIVIEEIHSKLSHLCSDKQEEGSTTMLNSSQLEECDAFDEESRTLARIDLETMEPTMKVMLGGQQWMLNIEGEPERAAGFCLRFDVDGCIWAPQGDPPSLNHLGTFLAFGYIEASKTNKKFVVAPPDLSYVAVADVTNHIMIYRKGIAVTGTLRNRKTGHQVSELATQQLVNLQTPARLLGAVARSTTLFLLTEDHIYALAIEKD